MKIISEVITKIIVFIGCVLSIISGGVFANFVPQDADTVRLNMVITGDLHADGDFMRDRNNVLRRSLHGMVSGEVIPDAAIFAGDLTNSADSTEYFTLKSMLGSYARGMAWIPAMGNHDARVTDDGNYAEAIDYFTNFCSYCGIETETPYYSTQVNGYSVIVLGSEDALPHEALISDTQLAWFDTQLAAAAKAGKPVFVVCHQPLYGSHGLDAVRDKGAGVGDASAEVETTMRKYTDAGLTVLYISGHLHWNFSDNTLVEYGKNLWSLNIPSLLDSPGKAVMLEVYDDCILLRGRDMINGEWIDGFTHEIELP